MKISEYMAKGFEGKGQCAGNFLRSDNGVYITEVCALGALYCGVTEYTRLSETHSYIGDYLCVQFPELLKEDDKHRTLMYVISALNDFNNRTILQIIEWLQEKGL